MSLAALSRISFGRPPGRVEWNCVATEEGLVAAWVRLATHSQGQGVERPVTFRRTSCLMGSDGWGRGLVFWGEARDSWASGTETRGGGHGEAQPAPGSTSLPSGIIPPSASGNVPYPCQSTPVRTSILPLTPCFSHADALGGTNTEAPLSNTPV